MILLENEKNIEVRGLELSQEKVQQCIHKGLSVIQGNAETELHQFPDQSFDYVVLSQTLQAFYDPEKVLRELLRIEKSVVISIPNFGFWKVRTKLLFLENASYKNIAVHGITLRIYICVRLKICSIFVTKKIQIKKVIGVNEDKTSSITKGNLEIKNFFSKLGIFLIG